jgi:hypothetical protein
MWMKKKRKNQQQQQPWPGPLQGLVSQSVSQPARSPGFVLSGGLGTPQLGTHLRDTHLG